MSTKETKEVVKETIKETGLIVNVTNGNVERFKQLKNQVQILNNEINNLVGIILEVKEIDLKDKKIILSEDFTTITIM